MAFSGRTFVFARTGRCLFRRKIANGISVCLEVRNPVEIQRILDEKGDRVFGLVVVNPVASLQFDEAGRIVGADFLGRFKAIGSTAVIDVELKDFFLACRLSRVRRADNPGLGKDLECKSWNRSFSQWRIVHSKGIENSKDCRSWRANRRFQIAFRIP